MINAGKIILENVENINTFAQCKYRTDSLDIRELKKKKEQQKYKMIDELISCSV